MPLHVPVEVMAGQELAYLNMSDPNQECPFNWTLTTSPVRGCGRSSAGSDTCDSVLLPVPLQYVAEFLLTREELELDSEQHWKHYKIFLYVSGLSLVHGPAGSRQHIVTFAAALDEQDRTYSGLFIIFLQPARS